jgi:DNA-binding response OmpR family regulator
MSLMNPLLLLAESDADLAEIYRKFLSRHGYVVEIAADGLECLAKLRCLIPDVLILDADILWGGGDGVLACLREEGSCGIPVVLTGTGSSACLRGRYDSFPEVQCLEKPFPLSVLLASVRFALTRGAELSLHDRPAAVVL